MDLYMQKEFPGADKQANWLPAPDGEFILDAALVLAEG